jgi:hypothetical protein
MAEQICVCPQCGKKYKLKEEFVAKSFSCKGCGATVWVGGKAPAPAPTPRRSGSKGAPSAKRGGRAAATSGRGGRRSHREAGSHEEEGGRRGRGREKPKSNVNVLLAVGAVAVIGIVVVIAVMSGKKKEEPPKQTAQQPPAAESSEPAAAGTGAPAETASLTPGTPPAKAAQGAPKPEGAAPASAGTPGSAKPAQPEGGGNTQPAQGEEQQGAPSPEGGETPTKLGGAKKTPSGLSKNDPPATLGHLDSTPPELRKQIDELIAVLLDPQAGHEVHEAKAKLAAIGKPAFLPLLGKMAAVRDTITDEDSMQERLIESSLMLADECLREMDGYLDSVGKPIIRPGTDKKYIAYILRLHYRRWNDGLAPGATPLKDMAEMPGPFDPSKMPKQEGGDDGEEGK